MDAKILGRRNKLKLQQLKNLKVLHNFKEVDIKDVEDPMNFTRTLLLFVIRTGWWCKEIMGMVSEATQALGLLFLLITEGDM